MRCCACISWTWKKKVMRKKPFEVIKFIASLEVPKFLFYTPYIFKSLWVNGSQESELSLSDHVKMQMWNKPLYHLSPPIVHFPFLSIKGNELTSVHFHSHQVILSFFYTGRSGAPCFPLGPECTLDFELLYVGTIKVLLNSQMSKCWPQREKNAPFLVEFDSWYSHCRIK